MDRRKVIILFIVFFIIGLIGLALQQTELNEILVPTGKISWGSFEPTRESLPTIITVVGFGGCGTILTLYFRKK